MNVAVQEQWNKKIDKELKLVSSER